MNPKACGLHTTLQHNRPSISQNKIACSGKEETLNNLSDQ